MKLRRSKAPVVIVAAALAAALAVLPGCDLQENADTDNGRSLFVEKCGTCHAFTQAGTTADVGPDLGQPMNPTQYLTKEGLRALIRNPKAVRTWPQQQMPAFDAKALSDADLDAVIAYLGQMARQ